MKSALLLIVLLAAQLSYSHTGFLSADKPQIVISDLDKLKAVEAVILSKDETTNLGIAHVTPLQMNQISNVNHFQGKCGGFEVLNSSESNRAGSVLQNLVMTSKKLQSRSPIQLPGFQYNQIYKDLSELADPNLLKTQIEWLSSYPTRSNKASDPNIHVLDLKIKLESLVKSAPWPYEIETIDHTSTNQKSLRLRILGKVRPQEIVVLGGHLDSINQSYFGSSLAPGADDNASGSSNLIEAVRILTKTSQPDRTIEFYWYAGEESGLLGSAEIAKDYKEKNKSVVAVLQLDMTLFPGSGEQVIGLVNDFTSPWLSEIFMKIYAIYLNGEFVPDTCGYGCSDHASWHRQGYPAVLPFESTTRTMNRQIHSENDKLDSKSSITHSNTFTKLAVLFALTLGNSDLKQPLN